MRIGGFLGLDVVLDAGQDAELALDRDVARPGVVHDLLVRAIFSSYGRWEPSIMTEEKP